MEIRFNYKKCIKLRCPGINKWKILAQSTLWTLTIILKPVCNMGQYYCYIVHNEGMMRHDTIFLQKYISLFITSQKGQNFCRCGRETDKEMQDADPDRWRTDILNFSWPMLWFHIQSLMSLLLWRKVFNWGLLLLVTPSAAFALTWLWLQLFDWPQLTLVLVYI